MYCNVFCIMYVKHGDVEEIVIRIQYVLSVSRVCVSLIDGALGTVLLVSVGVWGSVVVKALHY